MDSLIEQYQGQITAIAKRRRELRREIARHAGTDAQLYWRDRMLYLEQQELEWALRELIRSESGNVKF